MVLTRSLLGSLLKEDLRHLFSLRLPYITFGVVYNVLMLVSKIAAGAVSTKDFEDHLRKAFLRRQHRRDFPERRGRVVIMPCLSLAKDIDTVEEAREVAASLAKNPLSWSLRPRGRLAGLREPVLGAAPCPAEAPTIATTRRSRIT